MADGEDTPQGQRRVWSMCGCRAVKGRGFCCRRRRRGRKRDLPRADVREANEHGGVCERERGEASDNLFLMSGARRQWCRGVVRETEQHRYTVR